MMEGAHSRHCKNTFPDFSATNSENFLDMKTHEINEKFKETLREKIDELLKHLDANKREWINRNDSSIYTGNPGISYLFYFYGKTFNDPSYMNRALELIERAEPKRIDKKAITFLTGEAGRLALGAVINDYLKNDEKSLEMISRLKTLFDAAAADYDELLYGRAGYLYCLLFVNKNIPKNLINEELIKEVIHYILMSGREYASSRRLESSLMYSWHDSEYLGGAHGLAGILYVLLQAREYLTEAQLNEDIKPSIDFLMRLRYSSMNFPSSVGSGSDRLVHWCHGAPSMTVLFSLASKVFNEEKYLKIAQDCGEVVWSRGLLKKGCGICHGVSGNAYTFLNLFQETKNLWKIEKLRRTPFLYRKTRASKKNLKHLHRAVKFAEWCFDYDKHQNRIPDRPFSLFEGLAGIIYFLIDLLNPGNAKFPGYTL